jgi:hypothetical protein
MMATPRPAQISAHPANNRERRTAARLGVSPDVTVISVRPRDRAALADIAGGEHASPSRIYKHRWLVGPFVRQQWYPRQGTHKPVMIWPFVKGPEGAPFLHKDGKKPVVRTLR